MAECIEAFLASLKARKLSPATLASRRGALQPFTSFLADNGVRRFQDVTRDVYAQYRDSLSQRNFSQHTVENYLVAVRMLFDYLHRQSRVFENPTRFEAIRRTSPATPQVITVKEVHRLLNAVDCSTPIRARDRAMLEVLYATGMRQQELVALALFDVDLDRQTVRVMGKGRKERVLPLGKHAAYYIKEYVRTTRPKLIDPEQQPSDALWMNRYKRPLQGHDLNILVKRHAVRANIHQRVTTHTLRRSCATHMLANGASPLVVAEMLGHKQLQTLSHYLRVTIADLKRMHARSKPGK